MTTTWRIETLTEQHAQAGAELAALLTQIAGMENDLADLRTARDWAEDNLRRIEAEIRELRASWTTAALHPDGAAERGT